MVTSLKRDSDFILDIHMLCDLFCNDLKQSGIPKKHHLLRLTKCDYDFLRIKKGCILPNVHVLLSHLNQSEPLLIFS